MSKSLLESYNEILNELTYEKQPELFNTLILAKGEYKGSSAYYYAIFLGSYDHPYYGRKISIGLDISYVNPPPSKVTSIPKSARNLEITKIKINGENYDLVTGLADVTQNNKIDTRKSAFKVQPEFTEKVVNWATKIPLGAVISAY